MIKKMMITRASDRVVRYIEQYVQLIGTEKKEEVLSLFDNIHRLFPNWAIMSCPMMHPQLNYSSKNCRLLFGYENEMPADFFNPGNFFSNVHEADQDDLYHCYAHLHDLLEAVPPEQHQDYRFVLQYRFHKPNGQYFQLHDEKATLSLQEAGNLYYTLFRDLTREKPFNGVKLEVYKQEIGLVKIKDFRPSLPRTTLSKREAELVTLIRQGLSTKEIAWQLNISHNTVRNIKSNLFEKYKVNNMIELLNMTG